MDVWVDIAMGASAAVGFAVARWWPRGKFRERCPAREVNHMDLFWTSHPRCKEKADPRCLAGYCTPHCREGNRCKGECLKP
jgi:hypothetical protein